MMFSSNTFVWLLGIPLYPSPAPLDEDLSLPDKTIGKASTATITFVGEKRGLFAFWKMNQHNFVSNILCLNPSVGWRSAQTERQSPCENSAVIAFPGFRYQCRSVEKENPVLTPTKSHYFCEDLTQ